MKWFRCYLRFLQTMQTYFAPMIINGLYIETANIERLQINDLFIANELSSNVEKAKYILFHTRTDNDNIPLKLPSLQLNGDIETENSLKFLGGQADLGVLQHPRWSAL